MEIIKTFFLHHRIKISLLLIIFIAATLRFYGYENRWGLAHDQARDAIVVRYALEHKLLPLIGPFSASGSFVFGPHWYWIFMVVTAIHPSSVIAPWIFQSIIYVFIVFLMYLVGKEIGGQRFGILASLFTAVSTAQIAQSTNLSYSSFIGITSVVTLYLILRFLKDHRAYLLFLIGFMISLSVNIHFQAVGMLFLVPILLYLGKVKLKYYPIFILGFFLPFIPLIIFDLNNNFFQSKNLLAYLFDGKENIHTPKRWLTYAFETWPALWARVLGGKLVLGYITIALLGFFAIQAFIKKELPKTMVFIVSFFVINYIVLRYYKGPLYDSFIVFLHPIIILMTVWLVFRMSLFNKFLAGFLIISLIVGSLTLNYNEINNATNLTAYKVQEWSEIIIENYPDSKFAIYDYDHKNTTLSYSLTLFLQAKKKTDKNGIKIGVSGDPEINAKYKNIGDTSRFFYLDNLDRKALEDDNWRLVNPSLIYNSIQNWYK